MSEGRTLVVVVTGLSGSGKSTAVRALEDLGFFCVDNLPTPVVERTLDAFAHEHVTRVALGLDVRVRSYLEDATSVLDELDAKLSGADIMVISCDKLIRVDFSAAGTLLNWASAQHTQGHQAQFNDVHRLVAAFFNVIGINEVARVIPRAD